MNQSRWFLIFVGMVAAWCGAGGIAAGHDIPADVTIHAYFKPKGDHAQLLVRLPLKAMRDIDFPERQGYLDLDRVDPLLKEAATVWVAQFVDVFEDGATLPSPQIAATHLSLDSDTSFSSFDDALAHVTGPPLPDDTHVVWDQYLIDVLLEYPITSDQARFSLRPGWGRLGLHVTTALRYLPATGGVRAYEYVSDPGLVRLDPRWHQAALRFVRLGFEHILSGIDHLLFLLCLVIPFRRLRPLVMIVTAFTVAHSITLIAAANGIVPHALWFPPLVETLIAASIVYMALENIVGNASLHRRWIAAFGFGLVHGFGFSFALTEALQFAGSHLLTSLLSFNVGVELGQLLVVALLIPALNLLFRYVAPERIGTVILSALVAHTAWHWMLDRGATLGQYDYQLPDVQTAAGIFKVLTAVVFVVGLVWVVSAGVAALRRRYFLNGAAR